MAALALVCGLCGCSRDNGVSVGNVKTVSEGEEYFPLLNWIFSLNKDGLVIDGERKQPQEVANELIAIPFGDDFQIVIDGKTTGEQFYILFDEKFEEMYYHQYEFESPPEKGEYILCIEIMWGTERQYEGYQYFFKFRK